MVHLLSIKGQVSLAVEQNSSLTQDRLASRKHFCARANLTEASGTPNSIEEDSGRSSPALACPSSLQFPGMLQCPGTHISETLVKHLEKGHDNGDMT